MRSLHKKELLAPKNKKSSIKTHTKKLLTVDIASAIMSTSTNGGNMRIEHFENYLPQVNWRSRCNTKNLSVCYSGKVNDVSIKVVENLDNFSVKLKNENTKYQAKHENFYEVLADLSLQLNLIDNEQTWW